LPTYARNAQKTNERKNDKILRLGRTASGSKSQPQNYDLSMATRKNLVSLLGMFHCTFSNNWPKLATLADNGAQTNEHKAQRTKGAKKHQLPKGGATFPVEGWCG